MYKDIESVVVVTDKLEATFLPSQGGKLTSLVLRETGRDYLAQRKEEKYRKLGLERPTPRRSAPRMTTCSPPSTPGPIPTGR